MKIEHTEKGFQIINFKDHDFKECSLQQSSMAGFERNGIMHIANDPGSLSIRFGVDSTRMHLNHKQVKELIKHLDTWVKTGEF